MRGFLLYARSRYEREQDTAFYRAYMAETARNINEMIANKIGGKVLRSYIELLDDTEVTEERTPEEIIESIKAKLRKGGG